jgi:hypothetical protein
MQQELAATASLSICEAAVEDLILMKAVCGVV